MEFFIILFVIYFAAKYIFRNDNNKHTNTSPIEKDKATVPSESISLDNTVTKEPTKKITPPPKKRSPKPIEQIKVKLTDAEIRERFEEKYRNSDFEASEVTVVQKHLSHCPLDGTVLFNANVIYHMAWYKHIKCCPQCSHTFIEEPANKKVDFRNNKTILWVCKYQQTCNQHKHATTTVTGILFRGDSIPFTQAEVTIQYCYACKEYFITLEQFELYKKRYPKLLANFVFVSSLQNRGIALNLKDKESKLHLNGYNVSQKNNLCDEERHRILAYIIQKDILSKSEVIYYLSMFINRAKNIKNKQTAVSKWYKDLNWVNLYDFDNQPKVWIDGIM